MKSRLTTLASSATFAMLVSAPAAASPPEPLCPSPEPCRFAVSFATPENAGPAWDRFARELGARFDDLDHPRDVGDEAPQTAGRRSSPRTTVDDGAASRADANQLAPAGVRLMLLWRLLGGQAKTP